MTNDFWLERWNKSEIGFHGNEVNPNLISYWSQIDIAPNSYVLVPLCGKTLDIMWLMENNFYVVGVEISHIAVQSFLAEQNLQAASVTSGDFVHWRCANIDIMCGDFFNLTRSHLKNISGIYDRAALIALPADIREKYASFLTRFLPEHVQILLITLDYDQSEMFGPPFAVSHEEVLRLFEPAFQVNLLAEKEVLEQNAKFKQHGLTGLNERVYKLIR